MKLKSYGKINIGLRILGRRPDGYHEIETILQTIDLHDEIELRPSPHNIHVRCTHPLVPEDERNLVYKCAQLMKEIYAIQVGTRIKIEKMIPVGAGLGGGSSNAAVVLLGLAKLWGISLSKRDFFTLAGKLGSDVPFFIKGGTALATGRGQDLEYLDSDWGETSFVIVYPRICVSSTWGYENVKMSLTKTGKSFNLKGLFQKGTFDLSGRDALIANDLEKGVNRSYPVIDRAKKMLLSEGATAAAMTGSGSAVFGIFSTWKEARKAARRMGQAEWDVFLTKPINPKEEE